MKHTLRIAALGLVCAATTGCQNEAPPTKAVEAPLVKVSLPVKDTVSDYEEFTGRTDAIFSVSVNARVTGYLDKVNFEDGAEVNAGDLLFEIDPRPYQTELNRTEANVLQAEAHMKRLEAD